MQIDISIISVDEKIIIPKITSRKICGYRYLTLGWLRTRLIVSFGKSGCRNTIARQLKLMYPEKLEKELNAMVYDVVSGGYLEKSILKLKISDLYGFEYCKKDDNKPNNEPASNIE